MAFNLPVRGQEDWDDEINESLTFVKDAAEAAQADATSALANAATAQATADTATTTANDAAADVAGATLAANNATALANEAKADAADALAAAQAAGAVTSVAGKTGAVTLAKADVGLGNVDNTSDLNKPVSTAQQTAIDTAVGNVSLTDLTDVDSVATPADGDILEYDAGQSKYSPVNPSSRFAAADPSTSKLLTTAAAPYTLFGFIINEGDPVPTDLPVGLGVPIVGFSRPAAPSLTPSLLDDNFAQAANNVVLTTPEALAVDDYIGISIGWSNEAGLDHFTVTYSAGAGAVDFGTLSVPNATAGTLDGFAKITTLVPAGSTITITAKDSLDANINRVHLIAAVYRLPNIATTLPRDVQAIGGGSSSGTMTAITCGPTASATSQANEIVIGSAAWNSGASPTTRTLAGTNNWQQVSQVKSDNGASARSLAVFYKLLTATANPQLTTLMTASDNTTGQWATHLVSYKSA